MADFDKIIRNGTIVDGTGGTPAFRGDVAIKNGKIAMISGNIKGSATEELDATGCIVAPGAIDLHTHYDLQLNWEPYATMSGWHGVTSVTIGQCGFGFAPCRPEDREAAMRLMTRIEAIPLRTMELGLRWDWESFPQWMDSLDSHPLGINVGALVPFNTLRMYVMGVEDSRTVIRASDEQIREMERLQREAMQAGAFGWSAMKTLANRPDDGRFIPSQVAHNDEFLALAKVLNEFGVGHIGWTRGPAERPLPPGEPDLIGGGDPGARCGRSYRSVGHPDGRGGRRRSGQGPRGLPHRDVPGRRAGPSSGARWPSTRTPPAATWSSWRSWKGHGRKARPCSPRPRPTPRRRCSSWPSTTASTPCPTGLTPSSAPPRSASPS